MEKKKELLTRAFASDFVAKEDDGLIIEGQPVVYNSRTNLGLFDEIIEAGALDGADLKDVRLCLNHDTSFVYARSRNNNENSTMKIDVTQDGLTFRASLDPESPKARELYSAIKRQDIDKMSFMFSVDQDTWDDLDGEHPVRHINKIGKIVEISAVTFPAYDATSINARSQETLENARAALENAEDRSVDTDTLTLLKEKLNIRR